MNGEFVSLVPADRAHENAYCSWFNDFAVQRTSGLLPIPWTPGAFRPWFDRRVMLTENAIWLTIVESAGNRAVGFCGLRDVNNRHRSAEFFITIGAADCRGKGYGTEATQLTLAYGFDVLNLHNIFLDVSSASLAGIRAYEKAGFREIGRRTESLKMGGKLYDWVYMECLSTEFQHL